MLRTTASDRWHRQQLSRDSLRAWQLERLNKLLVDVISHNRFYLDKLGKLVHPLTSLDQLSEMPFTYKDELVTAPAQGEFAANLTYPLERYVRYHHTSGTRGRPMPVLDTADDWQWWIETWQYVLDAAEVRTEDRAALAFSFGPFIGFWSAYDAAVARGLMVIPTGGMNSRSRLEMIRSTQATVLFCTPSYALHLAEVAHENQIDPRALHVRKVIVAGEPGGSVPATRERIEQAWNATLIDHAGASEVGPWGFSRDDRGLHIVESEFIAEFFSVATGEPATDGELSELVLTSLGRRGSPLIRYRTGDLVRPQFNASGDCRFVLLEGGVLGRADNMLVVRGVNVFPSSIEHILRGFPEVVEFRVTATKAGAMDALAVEVEDRLAQPERIAREMQLRLGLKIDVQLVALGTLPRFEGKGQRFIDRRSKPAPVTAG
ncbi:Phenylacetate-coenzyme A ligase [Anatilimnocola aggregata]|uniref:Phenylacetate-coenzyme A ligase n=1 Tax=Anatilimnocola aggregata TaxID=2528021 RepID=A0A517YB86_9BACT|nr:AMP-binding protein [Anatilimnocola aggregata]QDU27510.1 Phenylacetate-coenzyme A ligase [Anatilimnocola aggregata]